MISIDTVYQRVLAFANKEQRGYITPQEFNLFANQAQMEIFEQYFYDVNTARRVQGNDTLHSDIDDMLELKMQAFERVDDSSVISTYSLASINSTTSGRKLPDNIYRVIEVRSSGLKCELLNSKDFNSVTRDNLPLIKPSTNRPVANIINGILRCNDGTNKIADRIVYFKKPDPVMWGYVVVNKKAMYDPSNTVDFEFHGSEEAELVYKILKYAGVAMKRVDVMQQGQGLETLQIQQEKQ